ncbi:anti-sigma factor family protein [Streptomyces sp. NPDC093568]|uniref:anti-sigma factor family protein n=1 Tax=Streptomyces sp. NPDC093568 TaxID=3366041 RepID=UPI0037F97C74
MNCEEFVGLVTVFLDGALHESAEVRCLVHLAECDSCETCLDQFRQTTAILGELPAPRLSTETRDRLRGAFRALPRD